MSDASPRDVIQPPLNDLRARLRGQLISPADADYDQARRVWNANIDRRPMVIARCTGPADVVESIHFARANNLTVAVRGGAHSAAGHATCDNGIVIDLTPMKGIRVDARGRSAVAQGGVTWAEFDRETQLFGLATTGGSVSNTGIAGLTLGGGIGWLMGRHGFSCDNLISADVVTADGRLLTASAEEHSDLFWALRGGGGNFGIVTSFEFRLHEVGTSLAGMVLYPLSQARDVLRFYGEFSQQLPDAAEAWAVLLTGPDGHPIVALVLAHNGDIAEGTRILAPARQFGAPLADFVQPMPYLARQTQFDAAFAPHGLHRYWKSGLSATLTDDLIDAAVEGARQFSSPMSAIIFIYVHGVAARVQPDATAAAALRRPQWDLSVVAQWPDLAASDQHIGWTRHVWAHMESATSGSAYVNHIAGDDDAARVKTSYGPNYSRLAEIKRMYDPANVFRLNANIRPA